MGNAHRGIDDADFFAADIGHTFVIVATDLASATRPDEEGALIPGRYLVQVANFSDAGAIAWVQFGPFVAGTPVVATPSAGPQRIPLSAGAVVAVELNVLKGYNDQVAAIMDLGDATVYLTRVSRSG